MPSAYRCVSVCVGVGGSEWLLIRGIYVRLCRLIFRKAESLQQFISLRR